ncbi:MAG TPA: UDP-N-acetylglucosamine 2-epimerase (non-hydrolyzing) [Candidatus Ratteibacteria bacterium]|nr:UDP-N-acetylglucosamine 2-epimerase (non-hydrolyzing) [Candidatus Ratteibacteria bacterium]
MKLLSIVGARPQFIKLMPLVREFKKSSFKSSHIHKILHTGQHYDYLMNKLFFDEFGLPQPDYNLEIGSGPHGYQTGEMLKKIEIVLLNEKFDIVIVYGDTNSTLAGALASVKLKIPVAHIESGLRSYNKNMPEEINRVLTDHISDFLFCPTLNAVENLRREGIKRNIFLVGDIMFDSLKISLMIAEKKKIEIIEKLNLKPKEYILATIHRAENTDNKEKLYSIFSTFDEISNKIMPVIVPLHPRTKKVLGLYEKERDFKKIKIIEPVSYFEMLILEKKAKIILTDSGGVQKEAFWLGIPCITLREETEWVETVKTGKNILVGTDKKRILKAVKKFYKLDNTSSSKINKKKNVSLKILKILFSKTK